MFWGHCGGWPQEIEGTDIIILPCHEFLKFWASQVETGPVSVSHRLVFRGSQVGQQRRHFVKRSPAYSFMVPENDIIMGRVKSSGCTEASWSGYNTLFSNLLLERYWPILSWLFHSRRWRARTLPSLMKDKLWLTESLGGESEAMSKKNLRQRGRSESTEKR